MDEIQRTLVKAGRKDLAQTYYVKWAAKKEASEFYNAWVAAYEFLKNRPKTTYKEIKKFLKKKRLYSRDGLPKVLDYLKQRRLITEKSLGKDLIYMPA